MRKSSKENYKLYIKLLKSKSSGDEFIYKNYKNLSKNLRKHSKQNYYSNLLEKRKDKTTMADLERNHRKSSDENHSLPTTLE